uniref:Uncharacterized protein n=1 Tax=Anguilla anguilla TaxID=7936 RepID=A0A0E9WAD1_ANGAN
MKNKTQHTPMTTPTYLQIKDKTWFRQ